MRSKKSEILPKVYKTLVTPKLLLYNTWFESFTKYLKKSLTLNSLPFIFYFSFFIHKLNNEFFQFSEFLFLHSNDRINNTPK